ncbi:Uncharacterised protein [Mycobacteroides abscessus subsp. massiliense]|nr:Uncharacterised protein [Mycobacteroides abscessus subsp. massiliense]
MHPLGVPRLGGPHRQLGFQPQHHALAVGVGGPLEGAVLLDAVDHQMRIVIDQGFVNPVGHHLGSPHSPGARQHDCRGPVGGCVEEPVLLAPWDAAPVLRHPGIEELLSQAIQRTRTLQAQ